MLYLRRNTIRFRQSNGRRGSVIVLVVAVLALLAVIGTVYIVSSRAERASATSSAVAENLDLAQKAVDEEFIRIIGDQLYDADGVLNGRSAFGQFGDHLPRRHDIPEFNLYNPGYAGFDYPPTSPPSLPVASIRDQSWLVSGLYRAPYVPNVLYYANSYFNDLTMPQTRISDNAQPIPNFSPTVFNPASGAYDINILNPDHTPSGNVGLFRVVADPLPNLASGLQMPNGFAYAAEDDALVQMLPFSEANGTRYRFGLRIIDSSRMANINVGMPYDISAPSIYQNAGTWYNTYSLASPTIFNFANTFTTADVPLNLRYVGAAGAGNPGREGLWTVPAASPFDYSWGQAAFRFENPFMNQPVTPFDIGDELELRSRGVLGTLATPRAAVGYATSKIWPNTLGNRPPNSSIVTGNLSRASYTAYSYSRDLRPYADPLDGFGALNAYTLQPSSGTWAIVPQNAPNIWPPYPACVGANPDISTHAFSYANDDQRADALVIAATNIASAMELCGPNPTRYSADEARAFAANYLTYRWNSWSKFGAQKSLNSVNYDVYKLSAGPSFIDQFGPCLRTSAALSSGGNYISALSGSPTKVFVGFAGQPFLNEVAIGVDSDGDPTTPKAIEVDGAIELYNPYDVALSLDDFKLTVNGADFDFTGKDKWIPPRGYYILTEKPGQLDAKIPGTAVATHDDAGAVFSGTTFSLKDATKIYLYRKYYDRTNTAQWAAVDQYDIHSITSLPPVAPSSPEIDFVARGNDTTNAFRWIATVNGPAAYEAKHTDSGSAPDALTLGQPNGSSSAVTASIPLYDRTLDLYAAPPFGYTTDYQRLVPANIADFNHIMRIANEIDPATGNPTSNETVTSQLFTKITTPQPECANSDFPADASIHFDFRAAANMYTGNIAYPDPPKYGDKRALRLLECLSFTDRVSDLTINLGGSNDGGLSKLRVPGQINVNTASPEVLGSIPVLRQNPALIGYILAYRWRTRTDDPRIPTTPINYQSTGANGFDFTYIPVTNPNYPGYGINTLAELQIPLKAAQDAYPSSPITYNISDRDQLWARMFNNLTVRSDTFVVYAYLEAVRLNPRYSGPFNNAANWYTTNYSGTIPSAVPVIGVTDNPNDSNYALLRLARRRWVAIVDRSQANYNRTFPTGPGTYQMDPRFAQPRIVAQKDMP